MTRSGSPYTGSMITGCMDFSEKSQSPLKIATTPNSLEGSGSPSKCSAMPRDQKDTAAAGVPTNTPSPTANAQDVTAFRPMDTWDCRDEIVMLLVDYRENGEHALDDANVAITVGHNNDHNVGEGEGQGWQFAGWCWTHDHYVEGKGKPVGWLPLPHNSARDHAQALADVEVAA